MSCLEVFAHMYDHKVVAYSMVLYISVLRQEDLKLSLLGEQTKCCYYYYYYWWYY